MHVSGIARLRPRKRFDGRGVESFEGNEIEWFAIIKRSSCRESKVTSLRQRRKRYRRVIENPVKLAARTFAVNKKVRC